MIELNSSKPLRIAVVADTHVPDRVNRVHPKLLDGLQAARVDYIFHCGDLSHRKVLSELNQAAPVFAVRGNRDLMLRNELPVTRFFNVNGVRILLTHGHLNPAVYWKDKIANFLHGYELARYVSRLSRIDPAVKIYIYGHTHHPENTWVEGKLFFNPGGSSVGIAPDYLLSYGLIQVNPDGGIEQKIVRLTGAVVKLRRWDIGESSRREKI